MLPRVLYTLAILFFLLFMPFLASVILLLAAMAYFRLYIEGIALFFVADLIYGAESEEFFGIVFASTILSAIFLLVIEILKKRLKFYPKHDY